MARILSALSALVFAACSGGTLPPPVTVPPTVPDCTVSPPDAVIEASGCLDDDGEWETLAVFTCDRGRLLYGIGNRWAFAGDDGWTVGGQALWDWCRPDR